MRNLTLLHAPTWHLAPSTPSRGQASTSSLPSRLTALAITPTSQPYVVSTSPSDGGLTLFQIHSLPRLGHRIRGGHSGGPQLLSSFAAPSAPPQPPLPNGIVRPELEASPTSQSQVRSITYLSDGGSEAQYQPALCLVTAGGDIALLPLSEEDEDEEDDDDEATKDSPREPIIVGSVEQGILSAQWSPDQELLVLITARENEEKPEQILLMTREWEVLSEQALEVDEFGEEVPINVGWGSKATQFHGSEGKQAAAAAAEAASKTGMASKSSSRGPQVPEDDGLPRVSWRGDGAFFAISSLEPFSIPDEETMEAKQNWHRVIRTYSRMAALSSTSDPSARGIGPSLSFKPTGILMATSQRFGNPFASGREGRHDVAFFERNGLRHGEFSLREEAWSLPREGSFEELEDGRKDAVGWRRGHRVREVAWNADGSALALWICRDVDEEGKEVGGGDGESTTKRDVVQIWTMGNYHWYLKSELSVPRTSITSPSSTSSLNLQTFIWHSEDPWSIYLLSPRSVHGFTFIRESVVSGGEMPHDAACVAVQDGTSIKLTPMRLQNVPPPMASFCLVPGRYGQDDEDSQGRGQGKGRGSSIIPSASKEETPIHLAWSDVSLSTKPKADSCSLLAILYQDGKVGLFRMHWGHIPRTTPVGGHRVPRPEYLGCVEMGRAGGGEEALEMALQVAVSARRVGGEEGGGREKIQTLIAVLGREASSTTSTTHTLIVRATTCTIILEEEDQETNLARIVVGETRVMKLQKEGPARIFAREPPPYSPSSSSSPGKELLRMDLVAVEEEDGTLRCFGEDGTEGEGEEAEVEGSFLRKLETFCTRIAFLPNSSTRKTSVGGGGSASDSVTLSKTGIQTNTDARIEVKSEIDAEAQAQAQAPQPSVVGLSSNGTLLVDDVVLAKDATSFVVSGDFVIWTNAAHEARFLPVSALEGSLSPRSGIAMGEGLTLRGDEATTNGEGDVNGKSLSNKDGILTSASSIGRRVERTSLIVAAIPTSMALVLQHSRGNLETICPRPLVLQVVRRCLDLQQYAAALGICRTHRLDLNILYDHDPISWEGKVERFVKQVRNMEHLNAFIQALRDEDVTRTLYRPIGAPEAPPDASASVPGKVNRVCSLLRTHLETLPGSTHLTSIITCHVSQRPPDYVGGLTLLRRLKQEQPSSDVADETAKYMCWLTDADRLFDAALGMYDFVLPLMVAQHSERKDPREYLPFLRELKGIQPIEYQKFKIDDHLDRHAKALGWIAKAGEERHDEAIGYMVQHELFKEGLEAWRDHPEHLAQVHALYGGWLAGSARPAEAAVAFHLAGESQSEVEAFKEAGRWEDALSAAHRAALDQESIDNLVEEMAETLEDEKRLNEAADLLARYRPSDVRRSISLYARAAEYGEAFRIASRTAYMEPSNASDREEELIQTCIRPVLEEATTQLQADIDDMSSQLSKTMTRLAELRQRKKERPEDFYAAEDGDVGFLGDAKSEVGSRMSAFSSFTSFTRFTRMTGATSTVFSGFTAGAKTGVTGGTGMTGKSKVSSRLKKKEDKKRLTGKKGSVYEEDYLFGSLERLVKDRLGKLQADVGKLLPYLVRLNSASALDLASSLRDALLSLQSALHTSLQDLSTAVEAEFLEIEEARLDALKEATSIGVGSGAMRWEDLQMAGLFAPQKGRGEMVAGLIEAVGGSTATASTTRTRLRTTASRSSANSVDKWRCEVLDALRPTSEV